MKNTDSILKCVANISAGIKKIKGLKVLGGDEGHTMVICFTSSDPTMGIYTIGDKMSSLGWSLSSLQNPAGLHMTITLRQVGREGKLLSDLANVVAEIQSLSEADRKGGSTAGIYGVASALPEGPINEILKAYNDVVYKL